MHARDSAFNFKLVDTRYMIAAFPYGIRRMQRIEADPDFEDEGAIFDADSLYGDSTTSITSSILRGVDEHGRTYAAYGKSGYGMPIDGDELDRIDMKHRMYSMLLDEKLFLSPIGASPHRVLDLGTGSGIWAIDFADQFPSADVLGVDVAPIQPDWVPPNCHFEIDDVEEQFTYHQKFDFIHSRDFLFSIKDWPRLVGQCYKQLVPGGYLELQCLLPVPNCDDDSAPPESGVPIFSTKVIEASQIVGWSLLEPNNFAKYLREAGFVNVVEKRYKVPTGPWPLSKRLKLIGAFEMQSLLQGASAFSLMAFSKAFGWTKEETEVFLVALRRDVKNLRYHTYYEFIVAYGQRPKDVGTTKEASPESPTAESVGSPGKTESEGSPPKV
ncbi:hypothetical protein VE04_03550 [Pseudogymnoascus sp. 24MN13]|nr:hypothetical protein VE04_03550 [Pseudogymnoascus sp. 24MN13]